ncbi:hypothetical protein Bhyg_16173 [Pseudolycoriella hygida]|uniref:Uncharacterized protein n=1 Tax=Pseudolycoriella hygida TaxID=35572 RepID=A0A9Q0MJ82_9DIPT|nr:hypothetical protein Bhyg_16173 [Pseudolycoriella hygida]
MSGFWSYITMKFLYFVIAILAPFSVSADTALQQLAWVVENMDVCELGANGEYYATPSVSNDGVNQFVTFTTTTTDDPGYLDSTTTRRDSYLSDTNEGYLELWNSS